VENGKAQHVSNTCWAFATLGIQAPSLFDAVDKSGQWVVKEGTTQAIANICWAFATLGIQAPSLFDAVDKRGQWLVENGTIQNVANTCWAAVILGLIGREDDLIRLLWNATVEVPPHSLSIEDLRQLHEAEVCIQIEGTSEFKKSLISMPRELREAVDKAVAASINTSSRSQSEVSQVLHGIGFKHEEEVSPFGASGDASRFMAIDAACLDRMVAIEFNGPSHYNSDGKPNGKTMMKKRLLEKYGWQLHTIPYWEWIELKGASKRKEYLKGMLRMHK
jgi:hypothetical protein